MKPHDLLRERTGLNLTAQVAERAVAARLVQLGLDNAQAYLAAISPDELKALAELVVVPESWMFRDPEAFAAVVRFVSARLAEVPDRVVRILSLPCAGGEEPYSIAMALADAGVPPSATLIAAVDLSEAALARARQGRYTRNAFRGADLSFRERHFSAVGAEYQINDALRGQVSFSQGNLLAIDTYASAGRYDILFCRNLLIYFNDATTATAISKLHHLLADDGLLFAGYAEVPAFCRHGFSPLRTPGAFALLKSSGAEPAPKAQLQAAPPRATRALPTAAPAAPAARPRPAPPAVSEAADPQLLLQQASQLADQGNYGAAANACQAVLATDPDSADAYYLLGLVSECTGRPGVAGEYWRRCAYLQPDHYEALCQLALLAETDGNAAQAESLRQRAARVFGRRDERKVPR
ncbi:MAG: tetratricopeptide repeat protein [Bdellovibrionales bacterium]|nr:tetratricopeptide repeat protein [Massilia sp.]